MRPRSSYSVLFYSILFYSVNGQLHYSSPVGGGVQMKVKIAQRKEEGAAAADTYLHGCVVHNHAVKRDFRVTAGNLLAALQEKAVAQLPAPANSNKDSISCSKR